MQLQRHIANFIKEDGTAISQLKAPDLFAVRPGEGPPLPAKQLALYQGRRQGRAVDRDQGSVLARAAAVDCTGHHAFASTGLAQKKNRRINRRDLLDLQKDMGEDSALADDLAEVELPGGLLL